ncbi:MAG TPA: TonB-dependent receptor [Terriglobales bacterium]|nr:TonB-dependent receptor [Terriglobales bacterium]
MSRRLMRRMLTLVFASILATCGTSYLGAQETRATVTGRIQDPDGAGIAAAKVTAKNTNTGVVTTGAATADGTYTIPFLIPGNYVITADAQGFKTSQQTNVVLHVGDKTEINFTLPLGSVQEVLTVSDTPPLLDTSTATRDNLIETQRVEQLPLVGRNPFMLSQLVPGVQFQGNLSFQRPFDNGDNANFTINGGLRQSNSFLIDGAPDDAVSDTAGDRSHANLNVAYIPSVDATQEFKIVNNFYDAQYGRTGGGIINVSTKSGTNTYHGTAYEFLRRYGLDANSISNKAAGLPRYSRDPVTKENLGGHTLDDWGGAIGGPVRIPGVYNGKDKTFFFFSYENYHEVQPTPGLTTVPTLAERQGDFSAAGEPTIYDPWSTRLDANGNCCIRDPFPGNIIPSARFNGTVGQKLLNAYPVPNVGTNLLVNNYSTGTNTSEDHFKNYLIRVDQNFGNRERMYFRYAHGRRNQFDHGAFNFTGPLYDAQDPLARSNDSAVIDSVTTLSNTMILDLRASLARYTERVDRSTVFGYDVTQLGFSPSFAASRFVPVPPRLTLSNTNIPDAGTRNPRSGISTVIGFQPSLQMIFGKHSVHVGADLRNIAYATGGGSFVYGGGQFTFNPNWTQANPTASLSASSGSAVASLLLGVPSAGIIQYTPNLLYRWWYQAYYVQDDIRVTDRLTLNAGLRFDVEGSPSEAQNRMNRGFNTTDPSPLAAVAKSASASVCPACQNLTGGLYFAGTDGQPAGAFNTDYNHVQPRIGAAYQLLQNTVLRGGYGRFYLPEAAFGASQGFSQDTAYIANNITGGTTADQFLPRGNNPAAPPLANPFTTVLQPLGSSAGLSTFTGQSIIFNNPDRKIPHVDQWSFGVQHQLPWQIKVDASYVGSHTSNINTNDNQAGGARNINVLSNSQIAGIRQTVSGAPTGSGGTYQTAAQYLATAVTNPFAGQIPNTNLNGSTVSRQQLLLPYPQFQSIAYGQESVGQTWYNALQLLAEKRYTNGLSVMVSYTFSKTEEALSFLNPQDPAPHKNISGVDRPHRLVISSLMELPFGRGHSMLGNASRPVELLVGGWSINMILTVQSGTPVSLPSNANLIADPTGSVTAGREFNTCVQAAPSFSSATGTYTPATPSCTPAWQIINSANLDLRTSGFFDGRIRNPTSPIADISLIKRFKFSERYNGQFRIETFNFANTWIPGGPNMNVTSSGFGKLPTSQSNLNRQIQLGFKFDF